MPAYKPIMKFLRNCPLYNAFTNCPSVVYQNFLREFWSTAVAFDPFPSTNEPEKRLLKEFLIKFSALNGQRPLTLDFYTFLILFTFVIQVLGGNYFSTEQVNSIQQLLAYSLMTGTEVDIGEIIYNDLDPSKVTDIELTVHMIAINNQKDSVSPLPLVAKPKKGKSQTVASALPKSQGPEASGALSKKRKKSLISSGTIPDPQDLERDIQLASTRLPSTLDEGTHQSKPLREGTAKTTPHPEGSLGDKDSRGNIPPADMEPIHTRVADPSRTGAKYQVDEIQSTRLRKMSRVLFNRITEKQWKHHKEAAVLYADLKASIDQYENITYRDQTGKLVEASMSSLDRSSTSISDLYKGLNAITQLLKDISNVIKDDPATNQKINEATKTFVRISSNVTEVLSLVKGFDYFALLSAVKSLRDHAVKQEEASTAWMKKDTSEIKSMMTEMYAAFQGHPSSPPSGSVTPTLALIDIQANIDKGKGIATESDDDPSKKLVKASSIVCPGPDEPEQIKKAKEEARLLAMTKPEVIKVVQEEAKKIRLDPKAIKGVKASEMFKKAQDAEHAVLKRQHTKKVRKSLELRKHKYDSYMWTVSSRLKPEPITDIKIYLKTKPVVTTVYRGTDGRNFEVHKPFLFGAFGIFELDELREIIPKKKNEVVKDLMNSLSQRYERLKKIPEEIGIHSALPAPAPEQASSRSSGRKWKHMKLEPETRIPGLECNQALPENVLFINNMVIEEPEYVIFFTDEFGDQAFQR
ncbi:hypothetical protein Tco_0526374 [Tanacetum coccineum]